MNATTSTPAEEAPVVIPKVTAGEILERQRQRLIAKGYTEEQIAEDKAQRLARAKAHTAAKRACYTPGVCKR